MQTDPVIEDDYVNIGGLEPENTYEMVVVSVDGNLNAESSPQEVPIPENGMHVHFINFVVVFIAIKSEITLFSRNFNSKWIRWTKSCSTRRCCDRRMAHRNVACHRIIVVIAHHCVHY